MDKRLKKFGLSKNTINEIDKLRKKGMGANAIAASLSIPVAIAILKAILLILSALDKDKE